jgi:spore coat protein U-like protein
LPRGATKVLDEMTVHGAPLVDHLLSSNPRSIGSWRQALGENTGAASGASSTLVLAIQGRTAAGQPAPAGAYSDVVTVVVTY